MMRVVRLLPAAVLLAFLGCAGARPPATRAPSPQGTRASARLVAPATPLPNPPASGPLPAVIADIPLGLPGGDAYEPESVASDGARRAVVLCMLHAQAEGDPSALAVLDPVRGVRERVWPLPGRASALLAASGGQAYVSYRGLRGPVHLAAVDLETGQVTAEVDAEVGSLVVDAGGSIYTYAAGQLEVRDRETLRVLRSLSLDDPRRQGQLALDGARSRLYVNCDGHLWAFRTGDLRALWQTTWPGVRYGYWVVDLAMDRLYLCGELVKDQGYRITAYDTQDGRGIEAPPPPNSAWQLLAADSQAGRLLFVGNAWPDQYLWQTDLAGRPLGVEASLSGAIGFFPGRNGQLLVTFPDSHRIGILDLASLKLLHEVPVGVEIRDVLVDSDHGRLYVDDSAGRLRVIDSHTNQVLKSVPAGAGPLVLDAANGLLFVAREPRGTEVAVVDTAALTVTAVITGGYWVAVDSAGHRAFVGGIMLPQPVQVWDTRTFQRLGAIPQPGEPAYNPLRDEVYLGGDSAYVVDGKSLAVVGDLTPDIGQAKGSNMVRGITVDPALDTIILSIWAFGGIGGGVYVQPRLFSARSREPVTHTLTVLRSQDTMSMFTTPPDEGHVYVASNSSGRGWSRCTRVYGVGGTEMLDYREGLGIDVYLPGTHVALCAFEPYMLAIDIRTWQPLGRIPYRPIRAIDRTEQRLYAWGRSLLTVLSFGGGWPLPPEPPEPWPPSAQSGPVEEICLSPAFARDRTVFADDDGRLLRSTDGGASWQRLRGGLLASRASHCPAVSPDFARDRTLFAGGAERASVGVWRSTDGGETWTPVWKGLNDLMVDELAISPRYAEDHTLVAYCHYYGFWPERGGSSLFRSNDAGATWHRLATSPHVGWDLPRPEDLWPQPAEGILFRTTRGQNGAERSTDGGRTWQTVLSRPADLVYGHLLAVVPSPRLASDRQVFALYEHLLCRSTDGGDTWEVADDDRLAGYTYWRTLTSLAVGEAGDGRLALFLGDYAGAVLRMDPAQVNWGARPRPMLASMPTATPPPTVTPAPPLTPP